MLISATVWRGLLDAGIVVLAEDARHVVLGYGQHRCRVLVRNAGRTVNPGSIAALAVGSAEPALLIAPSLTRAARDAAERAGWSWLVADDRRVYGVLLVGPTRVEIGPAADTTGVNRRSTRPGRIPWGTLTVARHLVRQPAQSQQGLAALAHISQPRVSQILRELSARRLVSGGAGGRVAPDLDRLVDWWLDHYPGPGGISTHWHGLDSPRDQAFAVVRLIQDQNSDRSATAALVSGDVAADMIAPWRSPRRVVVYARQGVDPAEAGLTPAGREEATLDLVVPDDPGMWTVEPEMGRPIPSADLLQVLWDVRRIGGPDVQEATARLREVLRTRNPNLEGDTAA